MTSVAKLLPLLAAGLFTLGACLGETGKDRQGADGAREPVATAADTIVPPEAAQRAREVANALGRDLQAKLFAALDSGGPAHAVSFCADSAQALSDRHASEGVYLRRVSLRVRNPANRPDSAEARQLRLLDSLHRAGALPGEVVRASRGADGRPVVEYRRPIVVQERCLACHGDPARLAPGVRPILAERYPEDAATGYRVGDLRGMISVRVPRSLE
jgi:hypothetical protein